jgi:hypothetical protein
MGDVATLLFVHLASSSAMTLIMYVLRSYQFRNLLTLIVENWSKFWY